MHHYFVVLALSCMFTSTCIRYSNHIISMHSHAPKHTHTHRIVSVRNVAMRNEKTNVPVNNFHLTLRLKLTHRIRAPIVQTYTYNHISDMESALHFVPIDSTLVWPVSLCISVERFTFYMQYVDDKLGEPKCMRSVTLLHVQCSH